MGRGGGGAAYMSLMHAIAMILIINCENTVLCPCGAAKMAKKPSKGGPAPRRPNSSFIAAKLAKKRKADRSLEQKSTVPAPRSERRRWHVGDATSAAAAGQASGLLLHHTRMSQSCWPRRHRIGREG